MNTITVIAAVADVHNIVLYKEDGETVTLSNKDYRTEEIMLQVLPKINAGKKAVVDLSQYNHHARFTESSGGLVKFFRVAKAKIVGLFRSPEENAKREEAKQNVVTEKASVQAEQARVLDIMTAEEVETTGTPEDSSAVPEDQTVVAVVGGKVIPHMEKLDNHIKHAARVGGSTIGMTRFLQRLAAVIEKRGHTIDDLLRFLEKADLPIADDGSIIAYKTLSTANQNGQSFVDVHSKKVTQRVGSLVYMDPSKVDESRRQQCSQGLHIARRDYLKSFRGDVIVLCKINPEDVIAVPHGETSKIRVAKYHIVALLGSEAKDLIFNNNPMTTDNAASKLLGSVIAGNHIGIIEHVEIKGDRGENVVVTPISAIDKPEPIIMSTKAPIDVEKVVVAVVEAKPAQAFDAGSPVLTPQMIREQSDKIITENKAKEEAAKAQGLTADQAAARDLFAQGKTKPEVEKALDVASSTLRGWIKRFGWTVTPTPMPTKNAATGSPTAPQAPVPNEAEEVGQETLEATAEMAPAIISNLAAPKSAGTVTQQAIHLYEAWDKALHGPKKDEAYAALLAFKKAKKKSWNALGYSSAQEYKILQASEN